MCGILGVNFEVTNFSNSLKLLNHRGPDNLNFKSYGNFTLGHTRLSIIDLHSEANQPMEFDNIAIVFNGEIYNYKELIKEYKLECKTKSDTEVIIRLYQKFDTNFLNLLNGMFAFAIYDKSKHRLFFARDRYGKKPFYYYYRDSKFIFASEIKSILKLLEAKPNFNQKALSEYLSFMTPLPPNTFYENIYKLPSGYSGTLDKELKLNKYYQLENIESSIFNEEIAIKEIEKTLLTSIDYRLKSDVEVATLLSGGIDSSLLSAIYAQKQKINTFSIGYDEYKDYDELNYAKVVAEYIGSNHHEITISKRDFIDTIDIMLEHLDEPLGDSASIPVYLLTKEINRQNIKVALSGEASDELFLGYDKYFNLLKEKTSYKSMANILGFKEKQKKELFQKYEEESFNFNSNYTTIKNFSYIDLKIWIAEVLMTKIDRMSMANSVELRAPFLDFNLVELSFKIDDKIKMGNTNKYLIKRVAEKYLPNEIIHRRKKGFSSPFIEWLYDEYRDEILNLMLKVNSELGIFNDKFLNFLYNDGREKGLKQHIWSIYIFCRWFEREYL